MEKTFDNSVDELIDLGSVTQETRGATMGHEDTGGGRQIVAGLTDD
ncbi:benenodin family lasso peptide [Novosphingobium sp. Fuku2-ISO-50]|nr:benenodin family lasso peptide [Novosphingobium sp. Fuku2-ISO-50]